MGNYKIPGKPGFLIGNLSFPTGNRSFLTGNRSFWGGDAESMIKKARWREHREGYEL
jgi:hypothetical protein